jgi:hypothetical protein
VVGVSITSPVPDSQGIAHTAFGEACFLCGSTLSDPAVHWMGSTGSIFLHPACVLALSVRLFRDVHEIEKPGYYRDRAVRGW